MARHHQSFASVLEEAQSKKVFLVQDSSPSREERIQVLAQTDPALSAILSVIHFEWTARRSIIALGTSPNIDIREKLKYCHGCEKYKDLWKEEVAPNVNQRLPDIVKDWQGLRRAFSLRHRLVHGTSSCGAEYARDRMIWAIAACQDIRAVCASYNTDIDARLPVRRRSKSKN